MSMLPKVSVCMMAYNHAAYIRQAVESALMQETDFEFEIVIGEDRSTDGTAAILQDLAAAHPGRIRLRLNDLNLGMHANYRATVGACRGEYIAFLEGDDFWTDRTKLQRQVAILDEEPDCRLVFHRVVVEAEGKPPNDLAALYGAEIPPSLTAETIVCRNCIATCSVLIRGKLIRFIPEWVDKLPAGDWAVWLLALNEGYARFIDRPMATYRQHAGGTWSRLSPEERVESLIEMLVAFEKHASDRLAPVVAQKRRRMIASALHAARRCKMTYSYRIGHFLLLPARVIRRLFCSSPRPLIHTEVRRKGAV